MKKFQIIPLITCCFVAGCYALEDNADYSCTIENGCLNPTIDKQQTLNELVKNSYDQIIFVRNHQYNLSKKCGNLKLSRSEKKLFDTTCDYLIFSYQGKLVNYVRGYCFTPSIPKKYPIVGIFDKHSWDNGREKRLLNQNINPKIKMTIEDKVIKINSNKQLSHKEFKCFTSFDYQAP